MPEEKVPAGVPRYGLPSRLFLPFLLVVGWGTCGLAQDEPLGPESREVRALLDKGKQYLESAKLDFRAGGAALTGLVFVKDEDAGHPKVDEALAAVRKYVAQGAEALVQEAALYDACLTALFLIELDAVEHRDAIRTLLDVIWARQQSGGAFGYKGNEVGDTSMTQYVILTAWTAQHHNLEVDPAVVAAALEWLIRTQTPQGAFGYHPQDRPKMGDRRDQEEVRLSLSAGGLGSIYISVDVLGLQKYVRAAPRAEDALPAAFRLVDRPNGSGEGRQRVAFAPSSMAYVNKAMRDGNAYMRDHFNVPSPTGRFDYYYLYALERYESFRAQIDRKPSMIPDWYERGVAWLREEQGADGSWRGECQFTADTAFACLFLLRSTEKAIQQNLGEGLLTGGRGMPKNMKNIRLRRGKVVSQPLTASPDEIFAILEDPKHPDFSSLADHPESVLVSRDAARRKGQIQRLRRLVQTGNTDARRVAVQALGQHRDFDNVPFLIYALGDKDAEVVRHARDALRFISRRFDGFGLPDFPDADEQASAIEDWKSWYRSVRPDARFLE